MSQTVMAESSSSPYTNSINFYERMSHLQGKLQGYESQQYQLQEEFQRLCTQGPSLASSMYHHQLPSSSSVFLPGMTSQTSTTGFTHTGPNLYGRSDDNSEIRRRARNQEILEKLEHLQTNASIYAARSERLQNMKTEYEALMRKYSSNRKWISTSSASLLDGNDSGNVGGGGSSHKSFTSTGVNTDISGPIKAISLPTDMLSVDILHSKRSEEIEASGRLKGSTEWLTGIRESNDSLRDVEEKAYHAGKTRTLPTFYDISSTSESDLQGSLHLQGSRIPHLDAFDDTSIDTTSQSVLPLKSPGSNYMLNVSTDGSLSESLSSQLFKSTRPIIRNPKSEKPNTTGGDSYLRSSEVPVDPREKNKPLLTSTPRRPSEINGNTKEDEFEGSFSSAISKTDEGLDDSILDSVQNKTPESLPRDDSELLHITEVDEEGENDDEEDEDPSDFRNDTQSGDLEYSGHGEESGENDTEKLKEARKEIGTWRFQKDSERLSNVDPEFSWANKFAASASRLQVLKSEERPVASSEKAPTSPVEEEEQQQQQQIIEEKAGEPKKIERSDEKIMATDQPVDRKERGKLEIERNVVDMTVPATKDEKAGNDTKVNTRDLKGSSTSSFMGSSSKQRQTGGSGSAGNESKKVRIKLDYDDSESEHSNAELQGATLSKADLLAATKKPPDDDFDDFFD